MKLRTTIQFLCGGLTIVHVGKEALNHDVMAAHALLQAIDEWTMAPAIKRRADELMREWTTSEPSNTPR